MPSEMNYDRHTSSGAHSAASDNSSKPYSLWQPWISDETSKQTTTKQLPTTKWKRERRSSRLAEYSRKSDPKLPENSPPELLLSSSNSNQSISSVSSDSSSESQKQNNNSNNKTNSTNGFGGTFSSSAAAKNNKNSLIASNNLSSHQQVTSSSTVDTPLDMSVRQRGLPPSYAQTISNPDYRSGYRPSVITQSSCLDAGRYISKTTESKSISMCDPIIDEHFRRSLGKDYAILFSNNNLSSDNVKNKTYDTSNARKTSTENGIIESFKEMMDTDAASLSVDDHFAKALGETWIKLNNKQKEKENENVKNTNKNANENKKPSIRVLSI